MIKKAREKAYADFDLINNGKKKTIKDMSDYLFEAGFMAAVNLLKDTSYDPHVETQTSPYGYGGMIEHKFNKEMKK